MEVPLLDLKTQYQAIKAEVHAALDDVLQSQRFILGKTVEAFETELAAYLGVPYAVGCASGSDALLLSLMAYGIGPADAVVTTPYSFFATAGAIVRLGATPIFLDVQPDTLNLDPERLRTWLDTETQEDAVTRVRRDRRTGRTVRAILPVHLFGRCADMDGLNALARKAGGLPVIEDAAQAIGSTWRGAKAGALGACGCFSFFPSKNLGGWGDGGMVVANDKTFAERVRLLRTHGSVDKYYHKLVGINSRLDALQAAVLRVKLRHLPEWIERRATAAVRYGTLFKEAGLLGTIEPPPAPAADANHTYHQYSIRTPRRDALRKHLKSHGVDCEVYYPLPLHLQECFRGLGYRPGDLPVAEDAAARSLALPMFPEITPTQQEYVVVQVKAFFGGVS